MDLSIIPVLILCGVCSSFMSALFGLGGGVLMVPILMTVFPQFSMQMVAATSLSIVIGTAIINLAYFMRQRIGINFKNLALWSLGMIVGVQAGFELSFYASDHVIVGVFVVTLGALSVKTFLRARSMSRGVTPKARDEAEATGGSDAASNATASENAEADADATAREGSLKSAASSLRADGDPGKERRSSFRDGVTGTLFCTAGGAVAGLTGVGGGSIMAPLISLLESVRQNQVAVYTNYMMVIGGLGAMYGYLTRHCENPLPGTFQAGYVNFTVVSVVIASSFAASFFSMKVRGIMRKETTNYCLSGLLLFIVIYTLVIRFAL